ncbi:MAG: PAS domain S-box protein, partial [Hyphomicrobiales bacterium]|nr:PAS domain S-box protein [Hyphomicrobiales bacterium]
MTNSTDKEIDKINSGQKINLRNSIATKLLRIVFCFYLVIAISVTLSHMALEYSYQKDSIRRNLEDIQRTFEHGLALNIWKFDHDSLRSTVEGMLKIPEIVGVKIQDENGINIAIGGIIEQENVVGEVDLHINLFGLKQDESKFKQNTLSNFDTFEHQFPLNFPHETRTIQLGAVSTYSNTAVVFNRVKLGFLLLIINAVLKTVALWVIFLWFSKRLLRKPLTLLTEATTKVNLENLDSFHIDIGATGHNELTVLEKSFNSMINNLHRAMIERKCVEEAMSIFRSAVDASTDAIGMSDPNGQHYYQNTAFDQLFGSIGNDPPATLYVDQSIGREVFQTIMAGKQWTGEVKMYAANREILDILLRAYPIHDADGQLLNLIGVHTDISKTKRAEQELHSLRNYLSNIIDSMPSILIGVDPDGTITQWNNEAQRVTGMAVSSAVGHSLEDVIPHLSAEMARVRQAIETHEKQISRKRPYQHNGEIRFEDIIIYPLNTADAKGAVIRVDDVTERVRVEEMMIQSEKMLSVGGLAAGMAHEINNPLAGMMQIAEVLSNRLTGDLPANKLAAENAGTTMDSIRAYMEMRDLTKMLENIHDSGVRAAKIVSNMLNFARKDSDNRSGHNLAELLDRCIELAGSDYDLKKKYDFRQIKIIREYEDMLPLVPCEAGTIQQVILNILRNGAEAMQDEMEHVD